MIWKLGQAVGWELWRGTQCVGYVFPKLFGLPGWDARLYDSYTVSCGSLDEAKRYVEQRWRGEN